MRRHLRLALSPVLLSLVLVGTAGGVTQLTTQTAHETSILEEVNRARAAYGLAPLRADAALVRAARGHSTTMLQRDALYHGAFTSRITAAGARGPVFGENLAWGTGTHSTSRAIVRSWLASPSHRANLLRPGFRRIGIGAKVGTFRGHGDATVVTADFAGR